MRKRHEQQLLNVTPMEGLRVNAMCLFAALTCPSDEDWVRLLTDVLEVKAGTPVQEVSACPLSDVVLMHMADHVAEA
jgi:hypothetical protein